MITQPIEKLVIQERLLEELKQFAEKAKPNESCALIIGKKPALSSRYVVASKTILTDNVSSNPSVQFEINPEDLLKAYNYADSTKQAIIGVFHSHPAPAAPSPTDIQNMKINPCVWIILGGENQLAAYQYRAKEISSVVLEITKTPPSSKKNPPQS